MHAFFMKSILYMNPKDNLGELINLVDTIHSFFLRKMLGTSYRPNFSGSRDQIFNSKDPNRVPETP